MSRQYVAMVGLDSANELNADDLFTNCGFYVTRNFPESIGSTNEEDKASKFMRFLLFELSEVNLNNYFLIKEVLQQMHQSFRLLDIGLWSGEPLTIPLKDPTENLKNLWNVNTWTKKGMPAPISLEGWRKERSTPMRGAVAAGSGQTKTFIRDITIEGKGFELSVEANGSLYTFELRSSLPLPKGYSLTLVDDKGESFEDNAVIASGEKQSLEISVQLELGDGITCLINPEPDECLPETFWFLEESNGS